LSDQVTRVLAGRIVNGHIGVDVQPPTEQDICAEFGVSKTTAREVIGALAARGLVTVRHGRRMEIRPVAEWNHLDPLLLELNHDAASVRRTLGDLHDLRMLLEPEIAARAALMATGEQLDRIRDAVERMGELEADPDVYLEFDVDFHSELAAATGNIVLAFVLDSVRELLRVSRRVTNLVGTMPEATKAHRRIYDALVAGEPEAARQAMRAHLLTVTEVWSPGGSDAAIEAVIQRGGREELRRTG
jgi:DNA-binding FadR family transcriptional regulator